MNYKQSQILLLLFSIVTFIGFNYPNTVAAKPSQSFVPGQSQSHPLSYQIETYNSGVMGGSRTYGVSLPLGYEQSPKQNYPVIFLLHGGHGDPTDWFNQNKGQALKTLENLYTLGKLPPSIIITPDGNDKRGTSPYWDPEYIDGKNGKVSTAVGNELVKVVKSRYRTISNPDFWAMGGLSSGGWGAINVGLHNLQNFSILFSHSGYFQDKSGVENSPITYIKKIPLDAQKRLRIYLDSGKSDIKELDEAQEFRKVLAQQKVYHIFYQFPGSHTWQYWREHLTDSLAFVGEQFKIAKTLHSADNLSFDKSRNIQNPY
jgi:enterochelin esterase-like enzyme